MKNFPGGPITTEAGFAINGHGYICAGSDSITGYNNDNEFWEYFPAIDSWQHKLNYPGVPREAPVSFAYEQYGFVGLGYGVGLLDTWRYNSFTDSWVSVTSLPTGNRSECNVAIIDSFAYILGGFCNANIFNDIWRYNIKLDHWDSIGIIPGFNRSNALAWTFDSIIIIGYGEEINGLMGSDVYAYNTKANTWDTLTCVNFLDTTADGAGAGCFKLGKTGYFFGGYKTYVNATYYNNLWSFDASQFFAKDTPNGITDINKNKPFTLYPNPLSNGQALTINNPQSGSVVFYDALGRVISTQNLTPGSNQISLTTNSEVLFYRATLQGGSTQNGKLVILR